MTKNESRYLYKAKDKDDGKWYEGYYMCLHDTTYCSMPSDNVEEARKLEEENTHHYIVFEQMTDWGLPNRHLRAEIDPTTLCACTGLKDKNGKLIWENDVVNCYESECFGVIKWEEDEARFIFDIVLEDLSFEPEDVYDYIDDMEVVGNTFDNPELLEVEE